MKRLNSTDIAKLAGVSRSTVSRVINNYPNVPDETRERVMRVIKENHYYPQVCGQMLNGMKKRTIGLFWVARSSIAQDPLSSSYFMHIVDAATADGYLVLSCIINNLTDPENIQYVRKVFMEGRIDAGIFFGVTNDDSFLRELTDAGEIIGVFDHEQGDAPVSNCLSVNFEQDSGEKAIEYLIGLGHRRIAIIDGGTDHISCRDRRESALRALARHGITIPEGWMVNGGIAQCTGYRAAKQLLENCGSDLPTAIFANNDTVAFGVYRALNEAGLRVPEDISVIGVDGHINGEHTTPPLTTITFDFKHMFSDLVDRVVATIEEQSDVPLTTYIEGCLTERASCRRISE